MRRKKRKTKELENETKEILVLHIVRHELRRLVIRQGVEVWQATQRYEKYM